MGFVAGFVFGFCWGILSVLFGFGVALAIRDRRREVDKLEALPEDAHDRVLAGLRTYWATGRQVYVRRPAELIDVRETVN